jgi:hypothetical protein
MQDGHPFDTVDRDEIRARQRRQLRLIEYWMLLDALEGVTWAPSVVDEDRDLVELELRRVADKYSSIVSEKDPELYTRMACGVEGRALSDLLLSAREASMRIPPQSEPLDEDFREAEMARQQSVRTIEPEVGGPLRELIVALVWADAVAGDYRDPRVRADAD